MSTSTMGPILCASEDAAALAAAEIQTAMPEAEIVIDGPTIMVAWTDDPEASETIAALVRPFGDRPLYPAG